jgi:MerR family transcriptional regulator, thiopeptide resistance regulator
MQRAPQDWAQLMADVNAAYQAGSKPGAPEVQALAQRFQSLIDEFTGGDQGIEASLRRLWTDRGDELAAQHNMQQSPEVAASGTRRSRSCGLRPN